MRLWPNTEMVVGGRCGVGGRAVLKELPPLLVSKLVGLLASRSLSQAGLTDFRSRCLQISLLLS